MNWMNPLPGDFPGLSWSRPRAPNCVTSTGNIYADLCPRRHRAVTGQCAPATIAAVKGATRPRITSMLPTRTLPSSARRAAPLGLRDWQFTLSATDANRFVIRIARQITERPKIIIHNHATTARSTRRSPISSTARSARARARRPPVDVAETTRVVEINDLDGLERELAEGDVACVSSSRR